MTDLLDLIPSFERHMRVYEVAGDTPSKLAGYLADAIEALSFFWPDKGYTIAFTPPYTYNCSPDIAVTDKRPIILMGSVIYKMGNMKLASVTDGDFSYNPFPRGKETAIGLDITELKRYIPASTPLARAIGAPLVGYNNIFNLEGYNWSAVLALFV